MLAVIITIIPADTELMFSFYSRGEAGYKKGQVQESPSVLKLNIPSQPGLPCGWEAPGIQSDWLVRTFVSYLYELVYVLNVSAVSLFPDHSYGSK